jgi:hypothetical protein
MSFSAGPYTVTVGGGALLAGGRSTATVTVPGARAAMHVTITPQTDPGAGYMYGGYVSANDTVTVWIMAILALTPASTVYNVLVQG